MAGPGFRAPPGTFHEFTLCICAKRCPAERCSIYGAAEIRRRVGAPDGQEEGVQLGFVVRGEIYPRPCGGGARQRADGHRRPEGFLES